MWFSTFFRDLSQSGKPSEIKPPLAIKERKKGNLWVQLNDFSFPSYFLTFSLFFLYSDAAFTNGNTVHPNPVSFHDKVTNMEALIRSLKTYYEVKIDYYWKKKSSEMLHNQNYRMLKIHEQFFLYLYWKLAKIMKKIYHLFSLLKTQYFYFW